MFFKIHCPKLKFHLAYTKKFGVPLRTIHDVIKCAKKWAAWVEVEVPSSRCNHARIFSRSSCRLWGGCNLWHQRVGSFNLVGCLTSICTPLKFSTRFTLKVGKKKPCKKDTVSRFGNQVLCPKPLVWCNSYQTEQFPAQRLSGEPVNLFVVQPFLLLMDQQTTNWDAKLDALKKNWLETQWN